MTREEAILCIKGIKNLGHDMFTKQKDFQECLDMAIKAIETIEEFENAQIITGGRLNGRTFAYKCGLEEGKRKALEQKSSWIPVSERLPENEQKVLVLALYRNNIHTITTGMYEDGSMPEYDSIWSWEDVEYEKWDDENDCGIIPEGWYEYHEFNPDGLLNYSIPDKVVAWMPLPEPAEVEVKE